MDPATDLSREAAAAAEAAQAAGDVIRHAFSGPGGDAAEEVVPRRNGRHDVVTRFDAAVERKIATTLRSAFPDDGFVGEEGRPRAASGRLDRTWIVDPIDGTVGFVSGLPFFSVSIALAIGKRIVVGVVHDPVHGETFVAERGRGGRLLARARDGSGGGRLRIRRLAAVADAVVCADPGDPGDRAAAERIETLRRDVRVVRTLGSTALSLAYLSAGRVDGILQCRGLQAVDIAAGGLLALEAGARVTDADGGRWLDLGDLGHGRGIAAGGRSVHATLLGRGPAASQPDGSSSK